MSPEVEEVGFYESFCQAKMLGCDVTLHAVRKIEYRVLRENEVEGVCYHGIWWSSLTLSRNTLYSIFLTACKLMSHPCILAWRKDPLKPISNCYFLVKFGPLIWALQQRNQFNKSHNLIECAPGDYPCSRWTGAILREEATRLNTIAKEQGK